MSIAKETVLDELFTRLAEQIGLTEDQLDDELDGPMSDTTARRLSAVFGTSSQFWVALAGEGEIVFADWSWNLPGGSLDREIPWYQRELTPGPGGHQAEKED